LASKLGHKNDVEEKPVDAMCVSTVIRIPDSFFPILDSLLVRIRERTLPKMLEHRDLSSSKYYSEIPCVLSKSLIRKYQKNKTLKQVKHIVLPICGDKGRQIKLADGGIRVPVLGKAIIPMQFPKPILGHVLNMEFFKRKDKWLASVQYNTLKQPPIEVNGCVGVDRNSVGHVATLSDPQNGKVHHFGYNPAGAKKAFRQRRANLQSFGAGGRRIRHAFRVKQSRRTKYENHLVSKQIVSYAKKHCRAIAVENLETIGKGKAKRYVQKSQWAFYQLLLYITYKAALLGVPVVSVEASYSSQECSRCGKRNKPNGKSYVCAHCKHKDHRDANAGFVVASRGNKLLSMGIVKDSESLGGAILVTPILEAA